MLATGSMYVSHTEQGDRRGVNLERTLLLDGKILAFHALPIPAAIGDFPTQLAVRAIKLKRTTNGLATLRRQ